jgi:group I intron endonuclease
MKKIIIDKTILLFMNIDDMMKLQNGDLKKIKEDYLSKYDNCIIFNYFDLKNHKNVIKDKINKLKHLEQIRINARECNILHIENTIKNTFLNENHIQGTDKSQVFYGAYYNDELISVMTFDTAKGMNGGIEEGVYDLSRFSVKLGYVVSGIFNKILTKFINDYSPKKVMSYADFNLVNKENNIYCLNNFKLDKIIQPDYKIYLLNKDELYHKFTYGSKFFKNSGISDEEKQNVRDNSIKVWNCGKLKYELYINENNKIVFGFIYMIKNIVNNMIYIGQTTRNLNKRIWEYKSNYNRNESNNDHLYNAFHKYGWDKFEFSIIDTAESIEELNKKEIEYIKKYNSTNKKLGYNLEEGGRNSIPSQETLDKMSKAHSGVKQSDEWIRKRIPMAGSDEAKKYGKPKTDKEKKYLSEISPKYWEGKTRDDETKRKISETKKAKGLSQTQIDISCKTVYMIDIKTNSIIKTFISTGEAVKFMNVSSATISRWCSVDKVVDDVLWTYNPDILDEIANGKELNYHRNYRNKKK